jgi:hypothetical protein
MSVRNYSNGVVVMNKANETSQVVSRILTEDVLSISQARAEIKNITGVCPDKGTMTRWYRRGVGGVKLEVVCLGSRNIFTSTQAITRFIEARTKALTG